MVNLPLLISNRRIKTLEELRENFILAELLERFRSGQLRAWLHCWKFEAELEQLEALPPDLPEAELAEALCRIFGIEDEAKNRALKEKRIQLVINGKRLKTLEELRENFNLAELLERFHSGQLQAWLKYWEFETELKQLEALSPNWMELELAEILCRIFGIEDEAKNQAIRALKEKRIQEEEKRRKIGRREAMP